MGGKGKGGQTWLLNASWKLRAADPNRPDDVSSHLALPYAIFRARGIANAENGPDDVILLLEDRVRHPPATFVPGLTHERRKARVRSG